jgi:hypothetical protein
MRDTRIPQMLLSEATKKWDGKPLPVPSAPLSDEAAKDAAMGVRPNSLWAGVAGGAAEPTPTVTAGYGRKKLNLAPRTKADDEAAADPRFSG